MIDPAALIKQGLKTDTATSPPQHYINIPLDKVLELGKRIPFNQSPSATKNFNLRGTNIGILVAGIAVVGGMTIQNLIDSFLSNRDTKKYIKGNYTVAGVRDRLSVHIKSVFDKAYKSWRKELRPEMEIIVSGYSKNFDQPEIHAIRIGGQHKCETVKKRGEYGLKFGGQHDMITRIVYGMDVHTFVGVHSLVNAKVDEYGRLINEYLKGLGIEIELPKPNALKSDFFDYKIPISRINEDFEHFSEQSAIDFVDFLIGIMIKSQEFSDRLPTVGGNVHIAMITKSGGFRWISKEEYTYQNHSIPKHEN